MNVKEIVELIKLLKDDAETKTVAVECDEFIGKNVMIRTYSAGVHFGVLEKRNGKEVVLRNSHRVYSWTGACSLSQLAAEGSCDRENSANKISMAVNQILLTEAIEIIPMTDSAFENLTNGELWKK